MILLFTVFLNHLPERLSEKGSFMCGHKKSSSDKSEELFDIL